MSKSKLHWLVLSLGIVLFLSVSLTSAATDSQSKTNNATLGSAKLYFSRSLVNDRIARSVNQNQPVDENIMNTPITGTTHLQGTIDSSLVANRNAGQIRILLKASSKSKTTGTHWPVIIHDQTAGKIIGSIDILLNGLNFSTEDEKAAADIHVTNQQVQSEVGSSGWVLSIAEDKIRDSEPEANLEAENMAEEKIRSQLKEQVNKVLQDAKSQLKSSLIEPLTKSGIRPHDVQFQTTNAWLVLTANWDENSTNTNTPPWTAFDPSAELVAVVPEATFIKVYNSLAGEDVKTIEELESHLDALTLPESWHQEASLRIIKKDRRDGNLILQWGQGE